MEVQDMMKWHVFGSLYYNWERLVRLNSDSNWSRDAYIYIYIYIYIWAASTYNLSIFMHLSIQTQKKHESDWIQTNICYSSPRTRSVLRKYEDWLVQQILSITSQTGLYVKR